MIKTYGLIFPDGRKELASVGLDNEGNPRIDTIRPYPIPDGWVDPTLVELVKVECPGNESDYEPILFWFNNCVERQWQPIS